MAAEIIHGKSIAEQMQAELAEKVAEFREIHGYVPGLAVILVGEDPASQVYVRNKHRACVKAGMYSEVLELAADTTEEELFAHIDRYMWAKDKFSNLACLDAVFQVNSDFFMSKKRLKDALWLFEKGYCHILGSDMHNLTERPTHMAEAYAVIEKKFGKAYTEYLDKNGRDILNNKRIHKTVHLPKVSKFSLLF